MIVVEPENELEFRRPFTATVRQTLQVSNASTDNSAVAFKVKTTTPKQYSVRPNSGKLLPGEKQEIQIQLQAMKEDPPLDYRCRDKFLVLSIRIPADAAALEGDALAAKLQDLWQQAESLKKNSPEGAAEIISEKKLRCSYLPPIGSTEAKPSVVEQQSSFVRASIVSNRVDASVEDNGSGTESPSVSVNSPVPSKATVTTDKDIVEARDKIKALQAACDAYKAEIERINQLRMRRGEAVPTTETKKPELLGVTPRREGLSIQAVLVAVILAFLAGVYLF